MGFHIFHTIVVTADREDVEAIHQRAREIFADRGEPVEPQRASLVSDITPALSNGLASFFIAPDGSKEGWETSMRVDSMRDKFIGHLELLKGTGQAYVHWVEVFFGADSDNAGALRKSGKAIVTSHSNDIYER